MHYYLLSALIFNNGQVRDGVNCIYRNESESNIIDFRNHVANNYAGPRETYTAIIITQHNEISKEVFNMYENKFSEETLQRINELRSEQEL